MSKDRDKRLENAYQLLQAGQYQKALREYEIALLDDPADIEVLQRKADLQAKMLMRTEAAETLFQLGVALARADKTLKAISAFKKVLRLEPETIDAHVHISNLYMKMGMAADAKPHLETLAHFCEDQGNPKELLNIYRQLVAADPSNVATRIRLGEIYSSFDMNTEAVREFSKAASELKKQSRLDEYIMVIERLIYHDPSRTEQVKEVANIYIQLGQLKKALGKLRVAYQQDPSDLETLEMMNTAFRQTGQIGKAIRTCKAMIQLHIESGALDQVQRLYRDILDMDPNDPDAQQFLEM
ncbi:MAG: hypothetical protein JXR96_10575 [Deltaproteobacteria bacterium]|nr:hypothetical protein [Deltaproteobacteria bacterium]